MTAVGTRPGSARARLEQISTRIVFFIAGFGMSAWAPLVPFVKAIVPTVDLAGAPGAFETLRTPGEHGKILVTP